MEEQKVLYPLTNAQMRIWETEQFYIGTAIANIGGALYLKEELDLAVWEECINKLIERNDSLRIRIVETACGPQQWIEPYRYQRIEQVDFSGKSRKEQENWLTNRLQIPFDVYAEPLYTFISIKAWDGFNGVFLKFYHILGDGWTIGLLSTQIMAEYARRRGKGNAPDSLEYSYLDFIKSEQEYLHSGKCEKDRQYWLDKFKLKPELVVLKTKNSLYYSSEAKRLTFTIEAEEAGMIRDYCQEFSTSPAILFEAALGIYLQRLHDQKNITLGVPVLNRRGHKELSTVGMYVSTIPIQIELDEQLSFADLCKQLGKEHFQCFRHQRYPYNRMLAEVREIHGIHDNLYDISVSYQNAKIDKTKHSYDFKTVWYFNGYQTESLCLHIDDRDDAGVFVLHLDFLRELFQDEEIEDIYRRIMLILWQAIRDGSQRISDLELVDSQERRKLLEEFNQTKADYPRDKTIHQLFEEQAARAPDQTAAVFEGERLTYEELNLRANSLASLLREKGVGREKVVGLMTEGSLEMVVGINQVYILSSGRGIQPIGAAGEICISGIGLARGYLNRPELTAEKFIANPFLPGERLYRTGDLGRWLPDGNIEFIGRIDHQVKIRGYRIELGEIEALLVKYEGIKEAAVTAREDDMGNKYLCAYFVSYREVTATGLREHLAQRLPDYMLPSVFIPMPMLPLTPNGKIDRQGLPEPEGRIQTGADYVPPSTDTEVRLARLWQEVLGFEKIGVNDSFFELGGHSLKAAILASKIGKEFKAEFPLRQVFTAATIREEAAYIDKAAESWGRDLAAAEKRDFYPASPAQRGLYLLKRMDKNSTSYNMPGAMKIEGRLDIARLKAVFKKLVQRHEAFRTSFHVLGEDVVQKIEDYLEFTVEVEELEERDLPQVMDQFVRPFDLSQAPLLRVQVLKVIREEPGRISPQSLDYFLLIDMHHIISDGTSLAVLVRDFISLCKGEELPELRLQYKDFAVWQNKQLAAKKVRKQKEYWFNSFQGRIPVLELPGDYPRPALQNFAGDIIEFTVHKELTAELKKLAAEQMATLYMLLLAVYNLLLYKYTGQEDIVVGSPIAGRQHPDLEGVIGMFVNTLAMRNYPEGRKSFAQFLAEVKEKALQAYENQDVPYKDLVEELEIKIDLSRNPLFDTMFILQNMDSCEPEIEGLRFIPQSMSLRTAKFDFTLTGEETGEKICFKLEYCTKLFKQETMLRFSRHFSNVLKAVTENPELKLADLDILSEEERRQLLSEFNQSKLDYPKDKLIHQLFEEQVEKTPENIALVFAEETLTYRELNSRANRVAQVLRGKGVGPESIVGLIMEPSLEMIVGIIAILKAGGAYLPIDPEYPEERIDYMLADSQAQVLLTQSSLQGLLERIAYSGEVIDLSSPEPVLGRRKDKNLGNLENFNSPENLAYVIYTSGSTGQPKGVLVEQKNLLAYVMAFYQEFKLSGEDVVLQQASYCFDAFGEEIYPVLLRGGRLLLASRAEVRDVNLLAGVIDRHSVSLISCSPLLLNHLNTMQGLMSVRTFISGGDVLKGDYIDNLLERGAQVYNTYGPTEATVCASYHRCLPGERGLVPVGKPIANYRIYILDRDNHLSPLNVPGELCIAGEGVSRGYLNRPDLTAEKFVANPFVMGERMYRSGDLARWLPDGSVQFLGRIDSQVKIRGFRIELGEIEARLLRQAGVKEAVVLAQEDNTGGKYLCAYLTGEGEIGVPELRKHLAQELPDYMIPSYFLQLEKLPLTPNGKIDKLALPEPKESMNTGGGGYIPPSTETELRLARLWQEVLGVERIGINDNFFELGGHSLKATLLVLKVQKEFGLTIPLVTMFSEGTIALLAHYIDAVRASVNPVVKADVKSDVKPAVKPDDCLVSDPKLVLLKAVEGARENLFLIHDGSCTVEGYVEFSRRLEVEANVWGIKGAEAGNLIQTSITIADLAADYLKTIKKVQPEGPYFLAGWSSGGVIAFEMALQIESEGERIRFVSMIDSPPPGLEDSESELKGLMEMWDKLEGQLEENPGEPYENLSEGMAQAGARAGDGILESGIPENGISENGIPGAVFKLISDYKTLNSQDRTRRLKAVKAILEAEITYQPAAKLQAELVYIGASESKVIPNQPWSEDCEKPVRYVEVKGDHFSIFKNPDVIGLTTAFARNFRDIPALKLCL